MKTKTYTKKISGRPFSAEYRDGGWDLIFTSMERWNMGSYRVGRLEACKSVHGFYPRTLAEAVVKGLNK
jgi:hypothetical protein